MSGAEALQMVFLFLFLAGAWSVTQHRKREKHNDHETR